MHTRSGMCSPPASIPLLQMMVKLTQAKKIVEVGVFTGIPLSFIRLLPCYVRLESLLPLPSTSRPTASLTWQCGIPRVSKWRNSKARQAFRSAPLT